MRRRRHSKLTCSLWQQGGTSESWMLSGRRPCILWGPKSYRWWLPLHAVSELLARDNSGRGLKRRYQAPHLVFTAAPLFVRLGRQTGCQKRAVSLTLSMPLRPTAGVCGRVTGRLTTSIVVPLKLHHSAIRAARRESPVCANCKKLVWHCAGERKKRG